MGIAAGVVAALAGGPVLPGAAQAADTGVLHLRCANDTSGANWPLTVDVGRGLVDSLPATISEGWISWNDPKQGVFELERASGKLRFRNASSTGGYYLYYTCRPE